MKLKDINALKKSEPISLMEIYKLVKNGEIVPFTDQDDNIIGFNCISHATGIKHTKIVNGHLTVGNTEEERKADEEALIAFQERFKDYNIRDVVNLCFQLVAADIIPDKIDVYNGVLCYIVLKDRKAYHDGCIWANVSDYKSLSDDDALALIEQELFSF